MCRRMAALTALDILGGRDDELDFARRRNTHKEQEVIRREFAMGMDDPDRMVTHLLSRPRISDIPIGCR